MKIKVNHVVTSYFIFFCFLTISIHGQIINNGIYQIYSEVKNQALAFPVEVFQDESSDSTINNLFVATAVENNDFQLFEFRMSLSESFSHEIQKK